MRRHARTNSSGRGGPACWRLPLVLGQIGTSLGPASFTGELCSLGEEERGSAGRWGEERKLTLWGLVQLHCLMSEKHKQLGSNDDLSSLQVFTIVLVLITTNTTGPRWRHVYFHRRGGEGSLINKTDYIPFLIQFLSWQQQLLYFSSLSYQISSAWTDNSEKSFKTVAEWDRS